ncbi:hypothetical protein [Mesorhizobium sp. Cs1299R1N3]|uniref:hypothetical protein n=1 Tax=Mesorhizobium sp. Cs1299R1N3 TaxID=3015173 RepID=UPI00301D0548
MRDFLTKLFHAATGGRPMRKIGVAYVERGTGVKVFYFVDAFGGLWMAKDRWSFTRTAPRKGMVQR